MEFIRKLFGKKRSPRAESLDQGPGGATRGVAPVQTQQEQDDVRTHMEAEMDAQRERREAKKADSGSDG